MKKKILKTKAIALLTVFILTGSISSCSSDDSPINNGTKEDISVATGTFKGKITVYPVNSQSIEYFDAIVTVTKVGDKMLKVTPKENEPYSIANPKTFQVMYSSAGNGQLVSVQSITGSVQGHLIYMDDNKSLNMITEKESAAEVIFSFEGTKQ